MSLALIAVAITAGVIAVAYFMGRGSGADKVKKEDAEENVQAAERIADAEAKSPDDRGALVERLHRGGKL